MRGESKIIQHGYRQFKVIKTEDIAKDHKTSIYENELMKLINELMN